MIIASSSVALLKASFTRSRFRLKISMIPWKRSSPSAFPFQKKACVAGGTPADNDYVPGALGMAHRVAQSNEAVCRMTEYGGAFKASARSWSRSSTILSSVRLLISPTSDRLPRGSTKIILRFLRKLVEKSPLVDRCPRQAGYHAGCAFAFNHLVDGPAYV